MLKLNDLISVTPDKTTIIEGIVRFVGIDSGNCAYLIRIDDYPLKAPFKVPMRDLSSAINAGDIFRDEQSELVLTPKELLSEVSIKRMKKAWDLIAPLSNDDAVLFDTDYRGRMLAKRAQECSVSPRLIRRLYYQYLAGGKTELALAPRFANSNGHNKKQKPGSKRRGRKAKNNNRRSQVALPDVRESLEKGAKQFFLTGKLTLAEAFTETKNIYFRNGMYVERNGDVAAILLPHEKLPSIKQFRYVCEELLRASGEKLRKMPRRIRQKQRGWDFRGRSRDGVPGPGFRFEIDATKLQIRIVSRYNRAQVLKSTTLYVVIDVWSGAFVGYALSLENASWALAARALHNCFTNKKDVFDRLGLDYTNDDWPCQHLPVHLAADRGELVSDKAGPVRELGIVVEIMPPMCPERKGKVESMIKNIKHGHSNHLPGRYPKFRQRREPDGIDSASLNIDDLEKIIVEIIIGLNSDPVPASYVPPEMIEEGYTDLTFIGLWRWGLQHRCGYTRSLRQQDVYTSLLAQGTAPLTSRGICFRTQTFALPVGSEAVAYKCQSGKGGFRATIRYDELRADCIWFMDIKTKSWVQAFNMDENFKRRKAGFHELEICAKEINELRSDIRNKNLHSKSTTAQKVKEIVKQSVAEAREDKKGISKSGRKKNMRINTQLEKEAARMMMTETSFEEPPKLIEESKPGFDSISLSNSSRPNDKTGNSHMQKPSVPEISLMLWERSND